MDTAALPDRCSNFVGGWGPVFGCKCDPHNVCNDSVPSRHLQAFTELRVALAQYIDKIKTELATDDEFWFVFIGRRGENPPRHVFAYLGTCSFKPKVQTMIRCSPGADEGYARDGFSTKACDQFPWGLSMMCRPSPLTLQSTPCFQELSHATSDELCYTLVVEVGADCTWYLRRLATEEVGEPDLKCVRAIGWRGEEVLLEPAATVKASTPDLALAWQRLQSRMAEPPAGEADDDDDGILPEEELVSAIAGGEGEAIGGGIIDDWWADFEEEFLAELGRVADPEHAPAPEGELDGAPELIAAEEVAVLEDGAGAAVSTGAASSGDAPAEGEAAVDNPAEGPAPAIVLEMSDKGFVTSPSSPFDGRMLGRITYFGTKISARCTLHKDCRCLKSIKQVSTEDMKLWLSKGEVVPIGSTAEQYAAARARHQERCQAVGQN